MSGGTPETMKMTHTAIRQQTTALTEGSGLLSDLTNKFSREFNL